MQTAGEGGVWAMCPMPAYHTYTSPLWDQDRRDPLSWIKPDGLLSRGWLQTEQHSYTQALKISLALSLPWIHLNHHPNNSHWWTPKLEHSTTPDRLKPVALFNVTKITGWSQHFSDGVKPLILAKLSEVWHLSMVWGLTLSGFHSTQAFMPTQWGKLKATGEKREI